MPVVPSSRRVAAATLAALAVVMTASGAAVPSTTHAADPPDATNLLDRAIVDLAMLEEAGPDGVARLLTIAPTETGSGVIQATILERDHAWSASSTLDVALPPDAGDVRQTRHVGKGPDRFALLTSATDGRRSLVVLLRTDAGNDGASLGEIARAVLPSAIEHASAADVDGDGDPELVVSEPPIAGVSRCGGSMLTVMGSSDLAVRSSSEVAGLRLAGGVIGRWDGAAGEELLAYAVPTCQGTGFERRSPTLMVVPLLAGVPAFEPFSGSFIADEVPAGAPLRVDVDADGRDEAIATESGIESILDPIHGWRPLPLGDTPSRPLIVAPAGPTDDGVARAAWLRWDVRRGYDALVTATIRRRADGFLVLEDQSMLTADTIDDPERWQMMLSGVSDAERLEVPPAAWAGGTQDPACHDLFVPLAMLPCGDRALRPAAAWVATRPIAAIGEGSKRRLLVAGGIGWDPAEGLPVTPTPWAAGPVGWWRSGPSSPFAISELRAADATYFREFPVPRSTVASVVSPDRTADLTGFTGTRLFVRSAGLPGDTDAVASAPSVLTALVGQRSVDEALSVTRIPVPPGVQAGGDGGLARVTLADVATPVVEDGMDGAAHQRWTVTVVSISSWGEVGTPLRSTLARDVVGPNVSLDIPFTSPVWPFAARLEGAAELGTEVTVGDLGIVELDRRGRFAVDMPLAPWPQTVTLTATDSAGNRTVREVSLIGGIDYRRLPWPAIAAVGLLLVAAISGVVGSRRARSSAQRAGFGSGAMVGAVGGATGIAIGGHGSRWRTHGFGIDDPPPPEIEDLPPGEGLPRADATD